jgi:succinylglutamic semialdehyde dehydrogenase
MHFINGLWVKKGSHTFTSLNPATGETIWSGLAAGEEEVTHAAQAARAAFPAWAALDYAVRLKFAQKFKELVESQKEDLALLIAQETGKVLWDARSEVAAVIAKLTYASESYAERTGTKSRASAVGNAVVRHRPHGVMAVYGPYNFPAHLPNGHIMPALLAGNTILFKPSEQTPLVAEWYVKQWDKLGLPKGVLNLLQGERDTGILLAKADINGVLFTGSSATGAILHKQFAGRPEIVLALEMGGNNPLIVHKVSDLKAAVHETLLSAFTGTGQRCTCARRLIVPKLAESEKFIELLVASAKQLKVGAYNETPEPFMGPLISVKESNRLIEAQAALTKLGGISLLKIEQLRENLSYISPGIIDMTGIAHVPDEEYFGPLLQLYRVETLDEAIACANATKFGLSAAILCDEQAVFQKLSNQIHAGLVNWNRQTTGASGAGPFGGVGISGNHRPAGYYSADYCAYPVASVEVDTLVMPEKLPPGMVIA